VTSQSGSPSEFNSSLSPHLQLSGATCPSCGQTIPLDKIEEISGKIALRERQQALAISTRLEQQHEVEMAQAKAKANADLDFVRRQSIAREAAVRQEVQAATEILIKEKESEAERARQELLASWQKQFEEAEAARKVAEQAGASLQLQMEHLRVESAKALEAAKVEAGARENEVRTEANRAAQLAMAEKLDTAEAARRESEAALKARINEIECSRLAAEQKETAAMLRLDELRKESEAEIARLKEEAATDAVRIRQEATDSAEALLRDKLINSEKTVVEANVRASEAEKKLLALTERHTVEMAEGLNAQREAMEKDKDAAVNAEKARVFEENQQLSNKVNELQRALEKKTNEELGEGAEIDLFEALKERFREDRINPYCEGYSWRRHPPSRDAERQRVRNHNLRLKEPQTIPH
jgi:hypothetical protein